MVYVGTKVCKSNKITFSLMKTNQMGCFFLDAVCNNTCKCISYDVDLSSFFGIQKERLHDSRVTPKLQSRDFNCNFAHFQTRTSNTAQHPNAKMSRNKKKSDINGAMGSRKFFAICI